MYLFQQDSLPETLTEMNESFIINTIYRHLERNKLSPPGIVKKLEDLPIKGFIYKLSELAFTGLELNQLVFTHSEVRKTWPEVDKLPGAINGFGLLQAVQHYPKRGAGRTTSVNFLHFTMQEYLAALHVSRLSDNMQLLLMERTFWDGQFNFMWMMYVGIVGVKSSTFTFFITSEDRYDETLHPLDDTYPHAEFAFNLRDKQRKDVYNDKRKCLHLFQCYLEAKSEIPKELSNIFTFGKIILNNISLLPHHILSLIFFMSTSSIKQWKSLEMDNCNLGDIGMNSLLEHVMKKDENLSTLEYVDLSGNKSSPWGVYCAIIRHCCVNSLTLCGDEGMKEYTREITDSLQINVTLQSLTLYKIGQIGFQSITDVLGNNTTLKELNMSWKSKVRMSIHRKFTHDEFSSTGLDSNSHEGVVDINILYDGDRECSYEVINMSNKGINDDAACLISFGLYNNTVVKKLDLSHSSISVNGMKWLSQCIKDPMLLEYVDLSGNESSPWGVYCAIIKRCFVNSLTLCGDEGMKEYTREITDSLQTNVTLQSLTLCKIGQIGLQSIKDVLGNNTTLKELNISWNSKDFLRRIIHRKLTCDRFNSTRLGSNSHKEVVDINVLFHECSAVNMSIHDDAVCLITFSLCIDTTLQKLDLSCNKITDDGAVVISDCFRSNCSLQTLILSRNSISYKGAKNISEIIHVNKVIQKLDMSHNNMCDDGAATISECLKTNNTLQELDLSDNWITSEGVKKIAEAIRVNKGLHKLNIAYNAIYDNGVIYISNSLKHHDTLLELNLSKNGISDEGGKIIAEAIQVNVALKKLDLSHNDISDDGMVVISDCLKNRSPKRSYSHITIV